MVAAQYVDVRELERGQSGDVRIVWVLKKGAQKTQGAELEGKTQSGVVLAQQGKALEVDGLEIEVVAQMFERRVACVAAIASRARWSSVWKATGMAQV